MSNRSNDERLVSIPGFLFGMRAKVGLLAIQDAFARVPRPDADDDQMLIGLSACEAQLDVALLQPFKEAIEHLPVCAIFPH